MEPIIFPINDITYKITTHPFSDTDEPDEKGNVSYSYVGFFFDITDGENIYRGKKYDDDPVVYMMDVDVKYPEVFVKDIKAIAKELWKSDIVKKLSKDSKENPYELL